MSSESIVTALFLISAVIAAGVLISAIFPAIYRTADTFGSASHEADVQMRTDIKIVNYFCTITGEDPYAKIWLKNIGTYRMGTSEIDDSDIFFGRTDNFERLPIYDHYDTEELGNGFWDQGETLTITIRKSDITDENCWPSAENNDAYFAIVLPTGVRRSVEFTADV
jgi:flagellar protein FlaG